MVDTTSDSMASIAFPSGPETEAPPEIPLQFAPHLRRLGADVIDSVLAGATGTVGVVLLRPYLNDDTAPLYAVAIFGIFVVAVVVPVLYFVLLVAYRGATLGKMAVGLKVVGEKGESISFGRACLRELVGKPLSLLILGIGFLMPLWDARRQALHDKIAHTVVVKAV